MSHCTLSVGFDFSSGRNMWHKRIPGMCKKYAQIKQNASFISQLQSDYLLNSVYLNSLCSVSTNVSSRFTLLITTKNWSQAWRRSAFELWHTRKSAGLDCLSPEKNVKLSKRSSQAGPVCNRKYHKSMHRAWLLQKFWILHVGWRVWTAVHTNVQSYHRQSHQQKTFDKRVIINVLTSNKIQCNLIENGWRLRQNMQTAPMPPLAGYHL